MRSWGAFVAFAECFPIGGNNASRRAPRGAAVRGRHCACRPQQDAAAPPLAPGDRATLVYISAADCPVCRRWEYSTKDSYLRSAEASRTNCEQVKLPTLTAWLRNAEAWPQDKLWLREAIMATDGRKAVPHFALVRGQSLIKSTFSWNEIRPVIRREAGLA